MSETSSPTMQTEGVHYSTTEIPTGDTKTMASSAATPINKSMNHQFQTQSDHYYEDPPVVLLKHASSRRASAHNSNAIVITSEINDSGDNNDNEDTPDCSETVQPHYRSTSKLHADVITISAFLLILGSGTAHSAFALISTLIDGQTGLMQVQGLRLPALVATSLQTTAGVTCMASGMYGMLVFVRNPHKWDAFKKWCQILIVIINLAPIAIVLTIVRLFQGAAASSETNEFLPYNTFHPTTGDIYFVVIMGLLVLLSVCATLIGGLTLLTLQLCALLNYEPRHKGYHLVRYGYYSMLVLVGGFSQVLLGLFLWYKFGFGPYQEPAHVATYTVYFPMISVMVGVLQCVMGGVGWIRTMHAMKEEHGCETAMDEDNVQLEDEDKTGRPYDFTMCYVVLVTWVITTFLQFLFQPSYGARHSSDGATIASVYLGFFVMPLYLDHLVQTTPWCVMSIRQEYDLAVCKDYHHKEDLLVKLFGLDIKVKALGKLFMRRQKAIEEERSRRYIHQHQQQHQHDLEQQTMPLRRRQRETGHTMELDDDEA